MPIDTIVPGEPFPFPAIYKMGRREIHASMAMIGLLGTHTMKDGELLAEFLPVNPSIGKNAVRAADSLIAALDADKQDPKDEALTHQAKTITDKINEIAYLRAMLKQIAQHTATGDGNTPAAAETIHKMAIAGLEACPNCGNGDQEELAWLSETKEDLACCLCGFTFSVELEWTPGKRLVEPGAEKAMAEKLGAELGAGMRTLASDPAEEGGAS